MGIKVYILSHIIFLLITNINGYCLQNDSLRYCYEDYKEDSLFYKNNKGQQIEKHNNQLANGYFQKTTFSIPNIYPLIETGKFIDGYIDGQCITSNESYKNKLFKIAHYNKGQLDGDYYIFSIDGSLKYHTQFIKGSGYFTDYYCTSRIFIKEKGELKNGKKEGIWHYYDDDLRTLIKSVTYHSDQKIDSKTINQKQYSIEVISLAKYRSKIQYGDQYKVSNTQFTEEVYISDSGTFNHKKNNTPLTTNLSCTLFDDQVSKGLIKGAFIDGYKYGEWIHYAKNAFENIIKIEHYDSGVFVGPFYVFDTNGKILYQTNFDNGTGTYKDFYPESGKLMVTGQYENGDRTGDWIFYSENGDVCQIQSFQKNKLVNSTVKGKCPGYILETFLYHTHKGIYITDLSLPPRVIKEVYPIDPTIWR